MNDLSLTDYQITTMTTSVYPEAGMATFDAINYCLVGMAGETGEIMNKWSKVIRDQEKTWTEKQAIDFAKELGDVLWFAVRAADEFGFSIEQILKDNLQKLQLRQALGLISGDGDDREVL